MLQTASSACATSRTDAPRRRLAAARAHTPSPQRLRAAECPRHSPHSPLGLAVQLRARTGRARRRELVARARSVGRLRVGPAWHKGRGGQEGGWLTLLHTPAAMAEPSWIYMSAARQIHVSCHRENAKFLECKQKDPNPQACLEAGAAVTSCVDKVRAAGVGDRRECRQSEPASARADPRRQSQPSTRASRPPRRPAHARNRSLRRCARMPPSSSRTTASAWTTTATARTAAGSSRQPSTKRALRTSRSTINDSLAALRHRVRGRIPAHRRFFLARLSHVHTRSTAQQREDAALKAKALLFVCRVCVGGGVGVREETGGRLVLTRAPHAISERRS